MKTKVEYKKSIKDSSGIYFSEKYLTRNINPYIWGNKIEKLSEKQKELLRSIDEYKNVFLVKGRQCGYSKAIMMKMVYDIVSSNGNENIILFTGNHQGSKAIIDEIEFLIYQVPSELWTVEPSGEDLLTRSFGKIKFFNGCSIISVMHPMDLKDKIDNVTYIYTDEWLFAENAKTMIELLRTDYGKDAKFILGSSPNNSNNLGYDEASNFKRNEYLDKNNYKLIYMGPSSLDGLVKRNRTSPFIDLLKDEYYGIIKRVDIFDGIKYECDKTVE